MISIKDIQEKREITKENCEMTGRELLYMVIDQKLKLPSMQRMEAWSEEKQSNYIANRIVNPSLIISSIVIVTDGKTFELAEGQQRILSEIKFFISSKSIQEYINKSIKKHNHINLLRLSSNIAPLRLKFSKDNKLLSKEQRKKLKGCTCNDINEDEIEEALDRKLPVIIIKVKPSQFELVRDFYIAINSGAEFTKTETLKAIYSDTEVYKTIEDIFINEVSNFIKSRYKKSSRAFANLQNALVDFLSITLSNYTKGSVPNRGKIYESDIDSSELNIFRTNMKKIMEIAKIIFPENNCFSEYDNIKEEWKSVTISSMLSWFIAIHDVLIHKKSNGKFIDAKDFQYYKNEIITNWKYMGVTTGRNNKIEYVEGTPEILKYSISSYIGNKIDNSNNEKKLNARAQALEAMLLYSMHM